MQEGIVSEGHPDPGTLERYARGELGREPRRALERHLAGCPACQAAVDAIPVPAGNPGNPGNVVRWQGHRFAARRAAREQEEERQENLDGVLAAFGPIVAAVSRGERTELMAADELRRRALIRGEPRFRSLALCELLQARCRAAWPDDPEAAVESAKLAVLIAERLAAGGGGQPAEDARAMSLMHLGESFRVAAEARRQRVSEVADGTRAEEAPAIGETASWPSWPPWPSWDAELALWELRDAFLARRMELDAALVCLDLAAAFLRQGREDDLRRMADESIPLFTEHGADPYVIDALRFLRDGERREGRPLTLDLLGKMARFLQESRHDPRR
jgi:hypothetical protein